MHLPTGTSSTVNQGSTDYMCYQAYPEWIIEEEASAYGVSVELMEQILYAAAGQTEACLLLDVYVPSGIFSSNSTAKGTTSHPEHLRVYCRVLILV